MTCDFRFGFYEFFLLLYHLSKIMLHVSFRYLNVEHLLRLVEHFIRFRTCQYHVNRKTNILFFLSCRVCYGDSKSLQIYTNVFLTSTFEHSRGDGRNHQNGRICQKNKYQIYKIKK